MEEDIKIMSDEIKKRLIQNPNLVITNTRFIDLLAKRRQKKVHSIRTDPKLKDLENHCRNNLKSKPLSQSMFSSPLLKVSKTRKIEKSQMNSGMTCTKMTDSSG